MRKVKVAAIQPNYPYLSEPYHFLREHYRNCPQEIMDDFVDKHLQVTLNLLERAGEQGCDIVTTSENITGTSIFSQDISETNILPQLLEISAPSAESRLSEIALKYGMFIVGCYNKRIDGKNYNIASIFDRNGRICGEYRKTHLPSDEKWQMEEGNTLDIFELDFGKIGVCICYDMMFPETVEVLSLKGAEIVFHPTAGYGWYDSIGEATIRTRANDNSVYIVTAKNWLFNGAGRSSVVDYWGHILVDAGFRENALVTADIDLDNPKTQPDWYFPAQTSGVAEVGKRMRMERKPELYQAITETAAQRLKLPEGEAQLQVLGNIKTGRCRW